MPTGSSKFSLRGIARAIDAFRGLDPEIQAQTIRTFIVIAEAAEPINMRDLQHKLGIATSSVSRNVAALSKHHRLGKSGHDLVEAYEDINDRRTKLVRLNGKGRAFASRLSDPIG